MNVMIPDEKSEFKILVTDDDNDLLLLTQRLLKNENYKVSVADSGNECLQNIRLEKPDLLLLDGILPDMSGVEVCTIIKQDPCLSSIYVLMFSGMKTHSDNISESLETGANGYLIKPMNKRELLARVDAVFRVILAEKKLRNLQTRTDAILAAVPDIIMVIDEKKKYTWANQAGYRFFGDDVIGKEVDFYLESKQQVSTTIHPLFNCEEDSSYSECWQRRKDGKKRLLASCIKELKDDNGHITGTLSTAMDITDRNQVEVELRMRGEILENMEEGVFLIRADNRLIVYTNPTVDRLFGYDTGELIGKHISVVNAPSEKSSEDKTTEIIESLTVNRVWQGEVQNIRKDGTLYWGHANISTFEHPQYGNVWISIHQDLTDRKRAEQGMRMSEEKYRTTLNASPDGILFIDLKGIITEVSEIGLEIFGADIRENLVGKHFLRFVPSVEKNTVRKIIDKTINEGIAQHVGLKIKKKNQFLFAGEVSATLIQGADGEPLSFMIIIRDISQRKKMETKQLHADRMANLGEMASGIAHEINQPLNTISMVMDNIMFEAAQGDNVEKGYLKKKSDKIFDNITRIRNIIDQVRAFSRSYDDYILTSFDINASINNAVSMLSEQFKHLAIGLNLQLEENLPVIIGNTIKFEQVIINLLANAKDAVIEKKSKHLEFYEMIIEIRSYQKNQSLIVEVTDNGIGISNDDINNIILPFYTTKDEGKGTGLGLSICYQIIKELNGTIEIASDKLHGTKIKVVLTIQKKN
ncbi:MAG: PAS domain S-box protein [Bacteroidetes bacterium]|nr:PAS domain S-box protein [Bacteroidota bacterium]